MLVITRNYGQGVRLTIDGVDLGTIELFKSEVNGNKMLGFDLDPSVIITRCELPNTYESPSKNEE